MTVELQLVGISAAALAAALLLSFLFTPVVKALARKVGAVDVPRDGRRMHTEPIPRLGGLAIFLGFTLSVLVFTKITPQMRGMLLGAVIIVILGVFDDIYDLPAIPKFIIQIIAATVAALHGNAITVLSNPNVFSENPYWELGLLSLPVTIIWIVAITNAVNFIDGLDGLAVGVSGISSLTLLVIALAVSEGDVAVFMAALAGACIGFMPYNLNPAKIFMGDTGATFLGFILSVVSVQGLFKFYTLVSFAAPFLMLGLPIFDITFSFIRRLSKGQSPMHADRSHVHHRLIDMGLSQKQAVAILYIISAILGLSAVVLTTSGAIKAMLLLLALCAAGAVAFRIFIGHRSDAEQNEHDGHDGQDEQEPRPDADTEEHT